jgi:hypothetical protein
MIAGLKNPTLIPFPAYRSCLIRGHEMFSNLRAPLNVMMVTGEIATLRSEFFPFGHGLTTENANIVSLGMAENVPLQFKVQVLTRCAVYPLVPFYSYCCRLNNCHG